MVITSISLFIYGIGTVTSLAMTYIEGARRDKACDISGIHVARSPIRVVTGFGETTSRPYRP